MRADRVYVKSRGTFNIKANKTLDHTCVLRLSQMLFWRLANQT